MSGERFQRLVFCVVLLVAVPMAAAEMITFKFDGVIDVVDDENNVLDGAVQVGSPFTGVYTFDSDTADAWPDDLQRGRYDSPGPTMNLTIGGLEVVVESGNAKINVANDFYGSDIYRVGGTQSFMAGDLVIQEMGFKLEDPTGSALDSDVLPVRPPNLTDYAQRWFGILGEKTGVGGFKFWGEPASLVLIPEPATFVLISGAALVVGRRRRFI